MEINLHLRVQPNLRLNSRLLSTLRDVKQLLSHVRQDRTIIGLFMGRTVRILQLRLQLAEEYNSKMIDEGP